MHEIKIITNQRAVTAAGTPEKIKEAPEYHKAWVISITIRAKTGNAGVIYVCHWDDRATITTEGHILSAGEIMILDVHDIYDGYIDLSKIAIDAGTSGDGISYYGFEVV